MIVDWAVGGLALAAILLPPIMQFIAIGILHRASQGSPIMALLERLRVAQCGFVGSVIISALGINGLMGRPIAIGPPFTTFVLAAALLINAAPAAVFAWLYWTGRFGDSD